MVIMLPWLIVYTGRGYVDHPCGQIFPRKTTPLSWAVAVLGGATGGEEADACKTEGRDACIVSEVSDTNSSTHHPEPDWEKHCTRNLMNNPMG